MVSSIKTEAKRALAEFRREVEQGLKIDADRVTFGEYSRQWINFREASGRLTPATIVCDRQILNHLLEHLEATPLRDIDAPTV